MFGGCLVLEPTVDGWWYSTNLPDGLMVATFMTDSDLVKKNYTGARDCWRCNLARSSLTASRMAGVEPHSITHVRPAYTQTTRSDIERRLITIGDARCAFDPLSSKGISRGFRDAPLTALAIHNLLRLGDDKLLYQREGVIDDEFGDYLADRHQYYLMEQRWSQSDFWRRRHFPMMCEGGAAGE